MAAIHRLLAQRSFNVQRRGLSAEMIMKKQNTGGRAFPVDCVVERDEEGRLHGFEVSSGGMTLRDYFAAKAMASIVDGAISVGQGFDSHVESERLAEAAYRIADAMLRAREAS